MRFGFTAHWLSAICVLLPFGASVASAAQDPTPRHGGILTVEHIDSPPSPSIQEEATASVVIPFMPLYNNLVVYDQHQPQNSLDTIVPELATAWRWNADHTELTFTLRNGVKWHDGKPFTSADVKCTWEAVSGLEPGKIRKSPRQAWFTNLEKITVNDPLEATFHLKRPQPAFLALLAAGWSPVYPCHVTFDAMRTQPIGTGPFRFVEFKRNEVMRLARNPDYWKPGLPYLDGIEYRIIPSRSTRLLAFIAGKFDMTYPTDVTVSGLRDIRSQAPAAQCSMRPSNVSTNLIINRDAPPFDNLDLRRALALSIDRKSFAAILSEGQDQIGASMLPPPAGIWGMPDAVREAMFAYGPDVTKNREDARAIMRELGYGPDKRLKVKVFTRDIPTFRDPALLMVDQMKEIYIDGELDVVDTTLFYNRVFRKDYTIGVNQTGSSVDDPDQHFYENYACGSLRNYTNYCNPGLEKEFDRQSMETDPVKRKAIVWEIERKLADDVVRPIFFHSTVGFCWQPTVKNVTVMVNSIYNGWRYEDIWLDR